jgi:hypothetical protein
MFVQVLTDRPYGFALGAPGVSIVDAVDDSDWDLPMPSLFLSWNIETQRPRPFWLKLTYAASVLVMKCWGWKRPARHALQRHGECDARHPIS